MTEARFTGKPLMLLFGIANRFGANQYESNTLLDPT
jgi:hypothetical protein